MCVAKQVDEAVEFKASQGRVHGFKSTINLSSLLHCGESGSADSDGVAPSKAAMPRIVT